MLCSCARSCKSLVDEDEDGKVDERGWWISGGGVGINSEGMMDERVWYVDGGGINGKETVEENEQERAGRVRRG